jgi:hypothetical protein
VCIFFFDDVMKGSYARTAAHYFAAGVTMVETIPAAK